MAGEHEARERLAEMAHNVYENEAILAGWVTNPASRTAWADVPEANKRCTRAVVDAVRAARDAEWVARIEGMKRDDIEFAIYEPHHPEDGGEAQDRECVWCGGHWPCQDAQRAEVQYQRVFAALDALLAAPREGTET